ncbi:hypothetical protein BU16DRAFT_565975 [Lophium mytilinum]|uniref:MutL C-terminal dimerisation domain-containing protein n=1 Tax=Lophium mytilinum TaxID=390894 RepID=A0A6A6QG16_9PEZI|nr:hypothetical protein BU16DRAFT_565975 [Lophium mytilinum]
MNTSKDALRNRSPGAILPLPADVIAQIKSSTAVTSLTGVVVELFKNALDAGATKLEATVDFGRGGCTVEDNGLGIAPQEFRDGGGLVRMYYTSRYNSGDTTFGRHGTFFASLAAMSLLTITSHHHEHRSHNTMTLHHCKPIARQTPAPSHHDITWRDHGTRVTVRDLFGNMPVRVKQRVRLLEEGAEHDRLWEALKKDVTGLVLGWQGECSIRIRDADKMRNLTLNGQSLASLRASAKQKPIGEKMIAPELQYMLTILTQASYIPRDDWKSWVPASASTSQISIKGAISLEPAPSKRVQFLSLGIRPLSAESGHNELYDEINRLFNLSSFGANEDASDVDDHEKERRKRDKRFRTDGFTNRQLRGARKGIDKWPMFSLRVCLKEQSAAPVPETSPLESDSTLQSIVEVLRAMLTQWLSVHHFRPRKQRKALEKQPDESPSPPEGEEIPPRATHSFFGRSKTDPDLVRVATPDANMKKRKRSTPSTADSVTKSRSKARRQRQPQPFTEWSRIKSGYSGFYDTIWNTRSGLRKNDSQDQENQASTITFSPCIVEPILQGFLGGLRPPEALSSAESTGAMEVQSPTIAGPHERESEQELSRSDETITWTNPSTRQTFLINARTGFVVPKESQRPQTESSLSSKPTSLIDYNKSLRLHQRKRPATTDETSNLWLNGVLNEWDNPVFKQAELSIPQVSLSGPAVEAAEVGPEKHDCGRFDLDKAFKQVSLSGSSKLSKDALQHATVIAQVDRKFILAKMKGNFDDSHGVVLVLIDQHAADERIRVEALLSDLCMPIPESKRVPFCSNLGHESRVNFTTLSSPLRFSLSSHESQLFRTHAPLFAAWGILYNLTSPIQSLPKPPGNSLPSTLTVITLPPAIAERCTSDPKLLINLLRSEVYKLAEALTRLTQKSTDTEPTTTHPWLRSIGSCPSGLLDLVNSRACRSAIMFNDELSVDECKELVRKLGACAFPFQCAHGRPSMVPLVNIGTRNGDAGFGDGVFGTALGGLRGDAASNERSFGDAFRAWKGKGRDGN